VTRRRPRRHPHAPRDRRHAAAARGTRGRLAAPHGPTMSSRGAATSAPWRTSSRKRRPSHSARGLGAVRPPRRLAAEDRVRRAELLAHIARWVISCRRSPTYSTKFNTALNRHNGTLSVSTIPAKKFDYESELVIIMGKKARNVSEAGRAVVRLRYTTGHIHRTRRAVSGLTVDDGKTPMNSPRSDLAGDGGSDPGSAGRCRFRPG